jgi:hypothetical protein
MSCVACWIPCSIDRLDFQVFRVDVDVDVDVDVFIVSKILDWGLQKNYIGENLKGLFFSITSGSKFSFRSISNKDTFDMMAEPLRELAYFNIEYTLSFLSTLSQITMFKTKF